jgi:type I restriction enzyme S subunit
MSETVLADVAEIVMGQSPVGSTYNRNGEGVPLLNGPTEFGPVHPIATQWTTAPSKFARAGDVLICVRGNTLGRQNISDGEYAIGRGLAAIRAKTGKANTSFIQLLLQNKASELLAKGNGSTFPSISGDEIAAIPFPNVSPTAQEKIAARLETQLTQANNARQAARTQLREISSLAGAIVKEAIPESVGDAGCLGDVLLDIQAGKSFLTAEVLARPDELGVLKVSALSWGDFNPVEAKSLLQSYEPDKRHFVSKGDFLISRANTLELVGAVVLVDRDYPHRLLSDKTLRLVLNEDLICKDYLLVAMRTPAVRKHIEANATGTSDSMRNIAQPTIYSIPLRLPSPTEQRAIAKRAKAQLAQVDAMRSAALNQLAEIDLLPQKILAQAFEM